ncbi:Glycine betaine/L-proline transport ATP-binding protein ProV [Dermatophilus congolensis]|uniref:ABC-type quaternary amine transporter n=1 Tax=Dermatophilus congolensis TaxID=1863 RepID=A0AA46BQ42_9MICO|nr:ATP-binding cassette domain-containing protein [Dermatophilus congolensis]STD14852.1 Glycine betaine/L-proline transport ATP-binding protein ProV [Dermatophilus congolensis]
MIHLDNVVKTYPRGTTAVNGLSLEAPTGKVTVLVGPSGCGKTTTLRMINRMVEPTSGTITINGRDTAEMNPDQLRRGIGYVIQAGGLFPHRTVLDNIATVPLLLGTPKKKARDRARELLNLVGLDPEHAHRYPRQLSGGQQQRVGVARALAADPPLILMDEPFSAVDPVVRTQLQDDLRRLQHELGTTIVLVTHDIDEAIRLGDHIAVLRVGGTLAQIGTPTELLTNPADDFVADFIGSDRGYRCLAFTATPNLPLTHETTVRLGDTPTHITTAAAGQHWILALDNNNKPLGWVETTSLNQPLASHHLHRGGTLATTNSSLRRTLDAALSSPSGRGVLTHPDGTFAGTIHANQLLDAIENTRSHSIGQERS